MPRMMAWLVVFFSCWAKRVIELSNSDELMIETILMRIVIKGFIKYTYVV